VNSEEIVGSGDCGNCEGSEGGVKKLLVAKILTAEPITAIATIVRAARAVQRNCE
jgi:hypothetical protein